MTDESQRERFRYWVPEWESIREDGTTPPEFGENANQPAYCTKDPQSGIRCYLLKRGNNIVLARKVLAELLELPDPQADSLELEQEGEKRTFQLLYAPIAKAVLAQGTTSQKPTN